MTELEIQIVEEFKVVDNICKDMFNSNRGISTYIENMEENTITSKNQIIIWQDDYKMLKHVRYIRNQIVHESGSSNANYDDLDYLENFHDRLLCQEDPLALLYKRKKETKQQNSYREKNTAPTKEKSSGNTLLVFLTVLTIILLYILVIK